MSEITPGSWGCPDWNTYWDLVNPPRPLGKAPLNLNWSTHLHFSVEISPLRKERICRDHTTYSPETACLRKSVQNLPTLWNPKKLPQMATAKTARTDRPWYRWPCIPVAPRGNRTGRHSTEKVKHKLFEGTWTIKTEPKPPITVHCAHRVFNPLTHMWKMLDDTVEIHQVETVSRKRFILQVRMSGKQTVTHLFGINLSFQILHVDGALIKMLNAAGAKTIQGDGLAPVTHIHHIHLHEGAGINSKTLQLGTHRAFIVALKTTSLSISLQVRFGLDRVTPEPRLYLPKISSIISDHNQLFLVSLLRISIFCNIASAQT